MTAGDELRSRTRRSCAAVFISLNWRRLRLSRSRVACLMAFSITALALSTSKSPGAICRTSWRAAVAFLAYSLGVVIASNLFARVVSIYRPARLRVAEDAEGSSVDQSLGSLPYLA